MHTLDSHTAQHGAAIPPETRENKALLSYIVVTPAKDEVRHIERTLQSMVAQTHLPVMWIVVDDGSSDGTSEIVQKYAAAHSFIRHLRAERITSRATGTAEVRAFHRGFELVRDEDYGCIVKLEADLSFNADYFEKLLTHFHQDPKLGIASGVYLETRSGVPTGQLGYTGSKPTGGQEISLHVTGVGVSQVPADAKSVFLNVTSVNSDDAI